MAQFRTGRAADGGLIAIAGEVVVSRIAAWEGCDRIVVKNKCRTDRNAIEVDDQIGALSRCQQEVKRPIGIGVVLTFF
jgi:hypothetical protein